MYYKKVIGNDPRNGLSSGITPRVVNLLFEFMALEDDIVLIDDEEAKLNGFLSAGDMAMRLEKVIVRYRITGVHILRRPERFYLIKVKPFEKLEIKE